MPRPTGIWMPLYVGDYLADTTHLETDEHGAYILLLMAYWRRGSALPDDDRYLRNITKLGSKRWRKVKVVVIRLFDLENGMWKHKRMEKEILRSYERTTKAVRSINARWARVKQVTITNTEDSKTQIKKDDAIASLNGLIEAPLPSPEKDYFRRVKEICGPTSGGLAKRLLMAKGNNIALARAAVETASTKENPAEYVGAILRGASSEEKTTGLRKVNGKWVDSW